MAYFLSRYRVLVWVISLFISSCQVSDSISRAKSASNEGAQSKPIKTPQLVWISLDGLNQEVLKPYLAKMKNPHPRGLKWILSSRNSQPNLDVGNPSITAPSHISTMTCSRPKNHGIFLNGGNWNGERDLSGFAMPYETETWVQALKQDHKIVAVAAYPSVDGTSPARSADYGIAYDTPVGKVQYVTLKEGASASIQQPSHQESGRSYEFRFELKNNQEILVKSDFNLAEQSLLPVGKAVEVYGVDGKGEKKRQAAVSFLNLGYQEVAKSTVVAVSPVSVMPVTGETLKNSLEDKHIVWSNLRDYGYTKYENGVSFALEASRHRRKNSLAAMHEIFSIGKADAIFLYFEDIDTLMHGWIGVSEVEDQLVEYLSELDQDLGALLSSLSQQTNIVIMGDHGMTPVQYELNVRELLPKGVASQVQIRTSGGTLLLYPPGSLDSIPPPGLDLELVADHLRQARVEFDGHRKVFNKVFTRTSPEALAAGLTGSKSPWLMAFADDGIGVTERLNQPLLVSRRRTFGIPAKLRDKYPDPLNGSTLIQPVPMGAHGHDSALPSMRTHLFVSGPALNQLNARALNHSIEVVPAVADALGWAKPSSCRSKE